MRASRIKVVPHDLSSVIDSIGQYRCSSGDFNWSKLALVPQKPADATNAALVYPYYLPEVIDPLDYSDIGIGEVNGDEGTTQGLAIEWH